MRGRSAFKLDIEKFRKVHSLVMGGATAGERSAARSRAEVMAARAGMTFNQAVSSMGTKSQPKPAPKPQPKPFDFGASFDDHMEEKHPGWKAAEAMKRAARDTRDAVRRAELLEEYGSEARLFAKTPLEALLGKAIAPLVSKWHHWTDDDGTKHRVAEVIDGRKSEFGGWYFRDVTPAIREAVVGACPWPATLDGALREVKAWDRLRWDRGLFRGEWTHYPEVDCRIALLEDALMSSQPAASWDDVDARFAWKRYEFSRQWLDPQELNDPFMERVEADIAAIRAKGVHTLNTPAPAPRTNAEKRAAVLSMLDTSPELADREIARRLGVSPQTVSTWRKKR